MAKNIFRGFIQNMLTVTPIKFHNPSFGIFFNKVHNEEGDLRYRGDTVLCRDDLYFPEVVDYLDNKYKNVPKVNVVMHACSDGEEVYSFLGVLKSRLKEKAAKFLPLSAKDIDPNHLMLAQKGVYDITDTEFVMANEYMNGEFYNYFEPMPLRGRDYPLIKSAKTVKVEHSLKSLVNFSRGDIMEDAKKIDFKNTVLFARNFWPYLENDGREKLVKTLAQRMDKSSTLIIGDYDKFDANLDLLLEKYGFEEKIENVFEKTQQYSQKYKKYSCEGANENYNSLYLDYYCNHIK